MIEIQKKQDCAGCYACANACPRDCIAMREDTEGFLYPAVDREACIDCGLCDRVCPIRHSPSLRPDNETYAAISKDEDTRMASSSGGVFSLLAEEIVRGGGVVFGAKLDGAYGVAYGYAETLAELEPLRKSKYVQARIGVAFRQAKEFLRQERKVLFSGTGCQIAGLRSFLGKEYENLISLDIICHGVPSPRVWQKYLEYRKAASGEIKNLTFRSKNLGWKHYALRIEFMNGDFYEQSRENDPYLRAFLKNLYLRPSCHACSFKTERRVSDLTLADYWGVRRVIPEMDDRKGTSLILVHSEAGRRLVDAVKPYMKAQRSEYRDGIGFNPSYLASVQPHPRRAAFLDALPDLSPEEMVRRIEAIVVEDENNR